MFVGNFLDTELLHISRGKLISLLVFTGTYGFTVDKNRTVHLPVTKFFKVLES